MDKTTRNLIQKTVLKLKKSTGKGDFEHASHLCRNIIDLSHTTDSEMGMFIGEVLEVVFLEYAECFKGYYVDEQEKANVIKMISPLIDEIDNSLSLNDDQGIYKALSSLRFQASKLTRRLLNKSENMM